MNLVDSSGWLEYFADGPNAPVFAKAFCCRNPDGTPRKHAGRIQGKALIWAEVRGGHVERIIERAPWPTNHQ